MAAPVVRFLLLLLGFAVPFGPAFAEGTWVSRGGSITGYIGPSTTKYFGAAFQTLNSEPTGVMAALAVDKDLLDLGWDTSLAAETQVTQYFFGHPDTTFAFGLGLQFHNLFSWRGTDLSVYDGPSYALDPPYTSIGYSNHVWPSWRIKFLNYVSLELATPWPGSKDLDAVFRLYHRSGAFGLYSNGDDDGLAIGLGLRYRF